MTPGAPGVALDPLAPPSVLPRSRYRRNSPALFPVPGLSPGPRGLRWALRQGLVQGFLLYPDSGGGGLRSPLLPAKHILAELGGVHTTPAGCSHAETLLEQPLQDLPGKKEGSGVPSYKSAWRGLVEGSQRKLPPPVKISTLITEVPVGQTQEGQKQPGPRAP